MLEVKQEKLCDCIVPHSAHSHSLYFSYFHVYAACFVWLFLAFYYYWESSFFLASLTNIFGFFFFWFCLVLLSESRRIKRNAIANCRLWTYEQATTKNVVTNKLFESICLTDCRRIFFLFIFPSLQSFFFHLNLILFSRVMHGINGCCCGWFASLLAGCMDAVVRQDF